MWRKCAAFVAAVCGQLPGAVTGALVTLWWKQRRQTKQPTPSDLTHFDLTARALRREERYRRERDKAQE